MGTDRDDKRPGGNGAAGPGPTDDGRPEAARPEPGPAEATVEDLIGGLEAEVQKLEQANKETHERLLRSAADFENFKRRAKKDLDEAQAKGQERLAREILPVLDNLERALKHATAEDPLAAGVRMVEKQMLSSLEKFGITRFSALGQPFDPAMHDAIQQTESAEVAPGNIAQEFAQGYLLNGRLLRPALVAVAKPPAAGGDRGEG